MTIFTGHRYSPVPLCKVNCQCQAGCHLLHALHLPLEESGTVSSATPAHDKIKHCWDTGVHDALYPQNCSTSTGRPNSPAALGPLVDISPHGAVLLYVAHLFAAVTPSLLNSSLTSFAHSFVHLLARSNRQIASSVHLPFLQPGLSQTLPAGLSANVVPPQHCCLHFLISASILSGHSCIGLLSLPGKMRGQSIYPLRPIHPISSHHTLM